MNYFPSSVVHLKGFCIVLAALEITFRFMDISTVFLTTNNSSNPKGALIMDLGRTPLQEVLHLPPQMANQSIDIP